MTTETPRTDTAISECAQPSDFEVDIVFAEHAKQLERELNECREKNLWQCNEILKMKKIMAAMPNSIIHSKPVGAIGLSKVIS